LSVYTLNIAAGCQNCYIYSKMPKIAIIEDEAAIAKMYEMELAANGFEVGIAANGRAGLELCEKIRPAVILLDMLMPEMGGREMLAELRKTDWGKKSLVIALTNLSQREAKIEMGKLGFDDFAVKAYYTPKQLREKVVGLLDQKAKPKH
jgi:two-component system response regulator AdeR